MGFEYKGTYFKGVKEVKEVKEVKDDSSAIVFGSNDVGVSSGKTNVFNSFNFFNSLNSFLF